MTLKEQKENKKRNKGNFIALVVTFAVFLIGCWWITFFYIPGQKLKKYREETAKIYGIENIIKIDTIEVNNFKHEFLTIRKENFGEPIDTTIHSPKCKCQPY